MNYKSRNGQSIQISKYLLTNRDYLIGRNPEKTNITIPEGTVSRIHAELSFSKEGKLYIKDLNSGKLN
jgi:pSer/pThr/pTyr-binding forkhead associated (FHA) protein